MPHQIIKRQHEYNQQFQEIHQEEMHHKQLRNKEFVHELASMQLAPEKQNEFHEQN